MNDTTFRPKVYLKLSCPFCLRLRIFLAEADREKDVDFVLFEDGDDTHRQLREQMEAAGQKASFPAVAFEPDQLTTGTDDLINRFAAQYSINNAPSPLLTYYMDGVFKQYIALFQEVNALRNAQ